MAKRVHKPTAKKTPVCAFALFGYTGDVDALLRHNIEACFESGFRPVAKHGSSETATKS